MVIGRVNYVGAGRRIADLKYENATTDQRGLLRGTNGYVPA